MAVDAVDEIITRIGVNGGDVISIGAAAFKDDKGRIIAPRLAEVIRDAGHVATGQDGRLWRYINGVYKNDGELFVRGQVRELLEDEHRRRVLDEVLTYLRSFPATVTGDPQRRYLNVANGLLDVTAGDLKPHDPKVISTVQLPVAWKPDATCPLFDAFITSALPEDALDLVVEIIGYALYAGNPYRKAVLLLGPGGNGKSVLLAIMEGLLGRSNCAHVPLQSLGENRFAAAALFGKLANICGDLDARSVKRTDLFKQITGGDAIFAEHKGRDPFSFTSLALPIFSANEAPISSDQSEAWFDRWLIVPMEHRFAGTAEEDPHLRDKLTTKGELQGLLVRAVVGLQTLMIRGKFELPPSVEAAGARYREALDSARGFVSEECMIDLERWTPRPMLYKAYRRWCQDGGRLPVSAEKFNDHLRKSYPMRLTESIRRGIHGWQGIALIKIEEVER